MKKSNLGKKPILIFSAAVILLLIFFVFRYYFEFMSIREIGANFLQVFLTNLKAKVIIQLTSFLLVFLIVYGSFAYLKNNLIRIDTSFDFLKKKHMIFLMSFVFSLVVSGIIQSVVFEQLLLFLNPTHMNVGEPIFFKDIGYYLFQRPFLVSLFDSLIVVFLVVALSVFILYVFFYLRLGITNIGSIFKVKGIAVHNLINLSVLFLIRAISYLFKAEEMLFTVTGSVVGASYTDANVWKTYYTMIPLLLIAIVALAIVFLYRGKIIPSALTIALYPVTYIVFLGIAMFTQTFIVKPQELTMEAPYIANNINYTKMAYGLSDLEQKEFPISYNLQKKDLEKAKNTLSNVRIIDYASTIKTINQVQSIRNFYSFHDLDIVKYEIDGKATAIALAARELNMEKLDSGAKNFINQRLRYTHGYGVIASHVNQVSSGGQPSFLIKDIPPVSIEGMPQVTQPRIYFGELTKDYVVVNSKNKEFDYAQGDTDVETSYSGKAGIRMSFPNRFLYALYYGDMQLFLSKLVTKDSQLLQNRNVTDRVRKVAPFLQTDTDPYILIDNEGRLKWIVNCYTVSNRFPYAKTMTFNGETINYIRESVKAVVDAYDGTVQFYITDPTDLMAQTYKRIYPNFFETEEMPEDLRSHLQYPEAIFKIQAEVFKRYHSDNTDIFYNKSDVWDFAKEKYHNEGQYVNPYYSLMSLFGEEEELTLMIPYTMNNYNSLVAWLGVSSDPNNYGKKILYTFPKGENVYGPLQIDSRIDTDSIISKEIALWGQGTSSVIRGNMLVVPIGNSLLYVEPIYIASGGESTLPELKRVIVAYKDKIVMEETFDKAIFSLFNYQLEPNIVLNETPQEIQTIKDIKSEEAQRNVVEIFDQLKQSMSKGNWQEFGSNFSQLEQEINKIKENLQSEETEEETIEAEQ